MKPFELLKLASENAMRESINRYPGKKTLLFFNGESEYTVCVEESKDNLLRIEPNLILIATYIDGKKQ